MSIATQVTFEHLEQSDAAEAQVVTQLAKLSKDFDSITSARVVVARPQHRRHKGDAYQVRIHLAMASAPDIVVTHTPESTGKSDQIQIAIDQAFKAALRQLRELSQVRQSHAREHARVAPFETES
jgi:ribosome-associated translation inhibitor RaiA